MKGPVAAALVVAIAASLPVAAARDRSRAEVYILAGQSNMSGRGLLSDLTPGELVADPRIRLYGNDGDWHVALDPLDAATGQIDVVSADAQAAVGPGLPFARELQRDRIRPVVLVPCAKGGSSIGRWKPRGDRSTLYGSCIARVREAGGKVAGILWYQGESDAEQPLAEAGRWTAQVTQLIAAFRKDLRAKRLPVVVVQIADRPRIDPQRYPSWTAVQAQQAGLHLRCVRTVSATGLPHRDDDLHLATSAQRILGARLALSMRELRKNGCR